MSFYMLDELNNKNNRIIITNFDGETIDKNSLNPNNGYYVYNDLIDGIYAYILNYNDWKKILVEINNHSEISLEALIKILENDIDFTENKSFYDIPSIPRAKLEYSLGFLLNRQFIETKYDNIFYITTFGKENL